MPPALTARVTPPGKMLKNGHSTKIAFSLDPNIDLWEKTVKAPGLDGGELIDITTMFNTTVRTKHPRTLIDVTDGQFTAAYDPDCYNQLLAIINLPGSITIHFPDLSTLSFFGVMRMFDPSDNSEGEFPEATVSFSPTNVDPTTGAEALPVLVSVAGT